ncbi:MAG: DUF1540 domain-containing protein [Ruminococcus sp.]|jgi:hypothetical protein|nr:DUF1540 domain-containing protein [Ruminococcus sp.]
MDNKFANQCIRCTVDSCKYHNGKRDYCSLDSISIGTHEIQPTQSECVDCESFEAAVQG